MEIDMTKTKDILDELTKDELLTWVRKQCFRLPNRSDILYHRWEKQSADALEEMRQENLRGSGVDLKERGRLAALFNDSTDSAKRLRLLKLIEPFDNALMAHIKRYQAIDKKMKRIDALYAQYEAEYEKERHRA